MQTRTSIGHAAGLLIVIVGVAVAAACGGTVERPSGSGTTTGTGTPVPLGPGTGPAPGSPTPPTPPTTPVPDWSDAQALAWLNLNCANCHGVDDKGTQQLYYAQWPVPPGGLGTADLENSNLTPVAYQTILNRLLDADGHLDGISPSPMPIKKPNEADKMDLRSILAWFDKVLPLAVAEADLMYGNDTSSKPKLVVTFTCSKPSTLRHHLGRFFLGALDRPPTPAELAKYTTAELDAPVTPGQRLALATLLETSSKAEFLDSGLRKLALLIGGGPDSRPPAGLSAAAAADLREELYQLMKARYDTLDYDKVFSESSVMVSANTAPLYAGCAPPAPGTWKACTLLPPRSGYFTTVGYLASLPMSFLDESNNYGRVEGVSTAVYGTAPFAALSAGPSGPPGPLPPTCLESTDTRTYGGAPRGVAAISLSAKICATCHLERGLSAGAVVLRPFASNGSVFDPATLGAPGSADLDDYTAETAPGSSWQYRDATGNKPVDGAFLKSLLAASLTAPVACLPKPGTNTYTPVKSIADLAAIFTANKIGVARGFLRHAQRAFWNSTEVPFEMIYHAVQLYDGPTHRIPDFVRAYFMSDTLACEGGP